MLHGYDNGHRLLAASVMLKSKIEMDAVSVLSDWSEYLSPAKGGDSSYITAYPLTESGYYVIAKSWYADEMKRPGCVWTHSLLLPIREMNEISDYKILLQCFKRPIVGKGFELYSRPIDSQNLEKGYSSFLPIQADREIIGNILYAFVNSISPIYFNVVAEKQVAETILAIMNVLPPRMSERVSWCSGSAYIRKLHGQPLSCQFLSGVSEVNAMSYYSSEPKWLTFILDGIMQDDVIQGQLIRFLAEDINDDARCYSAIASIMFILDDYFGGGKQGREERFKTSLEIIAEAFPKYDEGKVIKDLFVNLSFSRSYCQDKTFFYFFATLSLEGAFNINDNSFCKRWLSFVSSKREQYLSLLSDISHAQSINLWGQKVLKESVDELSSIEIRNLVENDFRLFSTAELLNPKILNKLDWPSLNPVIINNLLPMLMDARSQDVFTEWGNLFLKMLYEGIKINKQLASLIFTKYIDATAVLLDFVNEDNKRYVDNELGLQLIWKTTEILKWLSGVEMITDNVADAIVIYVNEHSIEVKSFKANVWKPFLGLRFHNLRSDVFAFMFSLSFNWLYDGVALELMRVSFYQLHKLQADRQLKYTAWAKIAPYMESLFILDDWDKCKKMRLTVIERLKKTNQPKSVLDDYTPDKELNELLKKSWK